MGAPHFWLAARFWGKNVIPIAWNLKLTYPTARFIQGGRAFSLDDRHILDISPLDSYPI
jgi:hypothetical protein